MRIKALDYNRSAHKSARRFALNPDYFAVEDHGTAKTASERLDDDLTLATRAAELGADLERHAQRAPNGSPFEIKSPERVLREHPASAFTHANRPAEAL